MSYMFPSESYINPHLIPFPSHTQATEFGTHSSLYSVVLLLTNFLLLGILLNISDSLISLLETEKQYWELVMLVSGLRDLHKCPTQHLEHSEQREMPIVFLFLRKTCPWLITSLDLKRSPFLCCQAQGESHKYAIIIYPKPHQPPTFFSGYLEILGTTSKDVGIFIWKPRIKRQLVI